MRGTERGLLLIVATFVCVAIAHADLDAIAARFGGGCRPDNDGRCIIRVAASGTDLAGEDVFLQYSPTRRGNFRNFSNRARFLDSSGRAVFRFRNLDGCYRVVDRPGSRTSVRSNVICESGGDGSSSSAGSSSSSDNSSSSSSDGSSSSDDGSSSSDDD